MTVGFFLLHYPVFSETFVSKELLTLQSLGVDGVIVCEQKNIKPPFHPHITQIKFPIIEIYQKIFSNKFVPIIFAHLYWLFKNPIGYLKSFIIFIKFLNFHHLRVFIKSAYLAKQLSPKHLALIYVHEVDSPCLYGLICSRLLNIPCGIIFHTQYLLAQNQFLKQKISYANFTIFQSIYSQQIAGNPAKSFVVSTPGIDTDLFKPVQNFTFPKQVKLLTIGRLEEAKGYIHLLSAVKILSKNYPDILLTIIGDGSLKPQFEKYIIDNKLQKNIKLLGFVPHGPELLKIIHQHQYFILPSIVDSQKVHDVHPNVVKEAMACGLITITSQLGGINEIIQNKFNGFIINRINAKNIAKKISQIHHLSRIKKTNISHQARLEILHNHQQQKVCQKLINVFFRFL
ncbi:glycosyltransferase [Candidatus Shapirobacteria bacterium]|nr:glycosyltransferase [Candidatus Shapirobacteria bacterium]